MSIQRGRWGCAALVVAGLVVSSGSAVDARDRTRTSRVSAQSIDVGNRAGVEASYVAEFHKWVPDPEWRGNVSTCTPSATSQAWRLATLNRVNWYRAMGGLSAVTFDDALAAKAGEAAVMMSAQGRLSHYPEASWPCFTEVGGEAAARSNLSLAATGAVAADRYMVDAGRNNATVGHRAWLLYPKLTAIGSGDAFGDWEANAMWVKSDSSLPNTARDGGIAWPSPGYFPDAVVPERWSYWSANGAADATAFAAATVSVTGPNGPVSVTVENREGFHYPGITFLPAISDSVAADTTYRVRIAGAGFPGGAIEYDVTLIDVNEAPGVTTPYSYKAPVCAASGAAVAIVTGSDENPDTVQWSVVAGADADYFGMNADGQAIVARPLDPNRLSYNVVIQAKDELGVVMQRPVTLEVVPIGADSLCPVRNVTATARGSTVNVRWEPSVGGATVTKVVAVALSGASCSATDETSCTMIIRTNGQETITVWANYGDDVSRRSAIVTVDVTDAESSQSGKNPSTSRTQVKSMLRGSSASMKRLVTLPAGKKTYTVTGGCRLNAKKTAVLAPKTPATCRLTVTGKVGKKKTTVRTNIRVL